jgi:hypothetical protein
MHSEAVIEMQEHPVVPVARRRKWLLPVVAVVAGAVGVGVGVVVATRDDAPAPASAAAIQLADINQACTTWMRNDARWSTTTPTWCQDMTGWMNQMANGAMAGTMMWGAPNQMLTTCRAWMTSNPSNQLPTEWCDDMMRGMWPHMNGDWHNWDDWVDGPMMGG